MFNASRSASSPDPHPAAAKVSARKAKKTVDDPAPVKRDRDLDAAIELFAEAKADLRHASERFKTVKQALAQQLLDSKVGRYDCTVNGRRYCAELRLADPDVVLRYFGEEPRS